MAGTQRQNGSSAHRLGYGLGQLVKRVRAAWFHMESRLINSAGRFGLLVQILFFLLKGTLAVIAIWMALYVAYWLAIVAALVVLGLYGITPQRGYRNGPDGWGFYVGSTKLHD